MNAGPEGRPLLGVSNYELGGSAVAPCYLCNGQSPLRVSGGRVRIDLDRCAPPGCTHACSLLMLHVTYSVSGSLRVLHTRPRRHLSSLVNALSLEPTPVTLSSTAPQAPLAP